MLTTKPRNMPMREYATKRLAAHSATPEPFSEPDLPEVPFDGSARSRAERQVLGAIMYGDPLANGVVFSGLSADDFADRDCRAIAAAAWSRPKQADIVTICAALELAPDKASANHYQAVATACMIEFVGTLASIEEYVTTLKSLVLADRSRSLGDDIAEALQQGQPIGGLMASIEALNRSETGGKNLRVVAGQIASSLDDARAVYEQTGNWPDSPALSTGIPELDGVLGAGFWPGEMIVLAGRPGMGKTTLGLNMARTAAKYGRVLFFSLEMAAEQIARITLAQGSKIDSQSLRRSRCRADELAAVYEAAKDVPEMSVVDEGGIRISQICSMARMAHRSRPLSLLVVDYLQLVAADKLGQKASREQEVSSVSRAFKALALEIKIPVLVMAQLNRQAVGTGKERKPQLHDLRESGSIEQDADVVIMLHMDESEGLQLLCRKNRNGALGNIGLKAQREFGIMEGAPANLQEQAAKSAPGPRKPEWTRQGTGKETKWDLKP